MMLEPTQEPSETKRSDAHFRARSGVLSLSEQPVVAYTKTAETIRARVLAESRRTYGATIDDITLESWVASVLGSLLTEQTRVTQFIPVLAMRDIREFFVRYESEAA
jgi:hypothetical protein